MCDTESDSNVNCGLLLVVLYQYWFIGCTKCITLIKNINNKGNWVGGIERDGVYGNSMYFLVNFSVNLKLL